MVKSIDILLPERFMDGIVDLICSLPNLRSIHMQKHWKLTELEMERLRNGPPIESFTYREPSVNFIIKLVQLWPSLKYLDIYTKLRSEESSQQVMPPPFQLTELRWQVDPLQTRGPLDLPWVLGSSHQTLQLLTLWQALSEDAFAHLVRNFPAIRSLKFTTPRPRIFGALSTMHQFGRTCHRRCPNKQIT